jgi:hypothetical protein
MDLLDIANAAGVPNDKDALTKLAQLLDTWGLDAVDAVNKLLTPEARAELDELRGKVETPTPTVEPASPEAPTASEPAPVNEDVSNVADTSGATLTFGDAIAALRSGSKVTRAGWNGKGMYLALQVPDANSKMTLAYIYMYTAQGDLVPWLASQTDVLSSDWEVLAG